MSSAARPLTDGLRQSMEARFGHDFSAVRVHSNRLAAESAAALNARAYTVGTDIAFAASEYAPSSRAGRHLLAHELTHVVQQHNRLKCGVAQVSQPQDAQDVHEQEADRVADLVTRGEPTGPVTERASARLSRSAEYTGCDSGQNSILNGDHNRAVAMFRRAIARLDSYDGTDPHAVHTALDTHFGGATGRFFASWVLTKLREMLTEVEAWSWLSDNAYACFGGGFLESKWACTRPTVLATAFWCVPGVSIRLCEAYWNQSDVDRSATLIHEWFHKYGCKIDTHYEHNPEYSDQGTGMQLINADSWANLVRDIS